MQEPANSKQVNQKKKKNEVKGPQMQEVRGKRTGEERDSAERTGEERSVRTGDRSPSQSVTHSLTHTYPCVCVRE